MYQKLERLSHALCRADMLVLYTKQKMNFMRPKEKTSLERKEVDPVEPAQMNIYQSNTYRKDLNWLHFDNEPRVHKRQQVKDQQSCISF